VRFSNTDNADHTVTAYGVPSGATPAVANAFMVTETVVANTHADVDLPALGPNDFLAATSSSAKIILFNLDGILFS
jgi:hypothetical protein